MKQKIKIVNQIVPLYEAIQLLSMVANEDDRIYYEFKEHTIAQYVKEYEEAEEIVSFVEEVCLKAIDFFSEDMEEVSFLFKTMGKSLTLTPAELCIHSYRPQVPGEPDYDHVTIKEIYEKSTEKEKDGSFLSHLDTDLDDKCYEEIMSGSDKERMCDILRYLQQLDFEKETKEKVLDCYLHRDEYIARVQKLVEKAYDFLSSYKNEYRRILNIWNNYWTSDGKTVFEMMDLLGVPLDKMDKELIVLTPSLIHSIGVDISISRLSEDVRRNKTAVIHMGVLVTKELTERFVGVEVFSEKNLQECIKVLGDKSKYDILMFIKDKPAYGSEIAKELGLTTATVSHHMNKLVNLQMVSLVQQGGKSYYKTRTDKMQEIFDALKKAWSPE